MHGHPDQKILGKTFELVVELATSFEGTITTKMRVKPTDTVSKIRERLAAAAARSRGPPPTGVVPIDVDGDGFLDTAGDFKVGDLVEVRDNEGDDAGVEW